MNHRRIRMVAVVAAAAGVLWPAAEAQDTPFKISLGPAYVAPMSDSDVTFGSISDTIKAEQQIGWNVGLEGRFTNWLGLEVDYVNANQDVTFAGSTIGDATF